MNSTHFFLNAAAVAAISLGCSFANAAPIQGAATGIASPSATITFDGDSSGLTQDANVTSEYAGMGVTFDPGLYFAPIDPDEPGYDPIIKGNFLGNYITGDYTASVSTFSVQFSSLQTRAAFGLAANGTNFLFEAFSGTHLADSFVGAGISFGYYGFTDSSFDHIVITSLDPDALFDFDNLQFDAALPSPNANNPSTVPEPDVAALLGLGLLGAWAVRRRSRKAA